MTNMLWPDFVRLQEDAIFYEERAFNIGRLDASGTIKVWSNQFASLRITNGIDAASVCY
jgi:hypothetical protein